MQSSCELERAELLSDSTSECSLSNSFVFKLGVVTTLPRSQLSPRIHNAREKEEANAKMLWWKWCDAPFEESRAWKFNIGGWLTGCGEMW